jgi:putative transposase
MPTNNTTDSSRHSPEQIRFLRDLQTQGLEVKLHLLQHYAKLAELLAREIMDEEVEALAGQRYAREKPHGGRYSRWGRNPGSIRIGQERVPVAVPRVRDTQAGRERPLESYHKMKRPVDVDTKLEEAILLGLSQRDYERVASAFVEGFGLSQAQVSRRFQERSRKALEAFENRSLKDIDIVALIIDGKYLAKHQMVICLGVDLTGHKIPLGFIETTTENSEAIRGLLQDLIRREMDFSQGLLCVVDGAKGLSSAVRAVFGEYAVVQRCQWHKRENVVSYLNESDKEVYRGKLQRAYSLPDYQEAREALLEIHSELQTLNRSAANSLMEGLEETLTLHRLGLFEQLGRTFKTTNAIENVNSLLARYLGKVKRWMHSDQRQRWVALGLLEVEQRMRRIDNHTALPNLRAALEHQVAQHQAENEPRAQLNFN